MVFRIKSFFLIIFIVFILSSSSCKIAGFQVISLSEKNFRAISLYENEKNRLDKWAKPLKREGLPNLFKVSDKIYRGGQPEREGFKELKKLGIKTIIDLTDSGKDKKYIAGFDFIYKKIPLSASAPDKQKFISVLDLMAKPDLLPIFIHCQYGADRTGAAIALYRIKFEDWKAHDAIVEMILGGHKFHRKYGKILPAFIWNLDKESKIWKN